MFHVNHSADTLYEPLHRTGIELYIGTVKVNQSIDQNQSVQYHSSLCSFRQSRKHSFTRFLRILFTLLLYHISKGQQLLRTILYSLYSVSLAQIFTLYRFFTSRRVTFLYSVLFLSVYRFVPVLSSHSFLTLLLYHIGIETQTIRTILNIFYILIP